MASSWISAVRPASSVNFLYISASATVGFDDTTFQIVRFDPQVISVCVGALGDYPAACSIFTARAMDQEGNLYVAEVANDASKNSPRAGANPRFLVASGVFGLKYRLPY